MKSAKAPTAVIAEDEKTLADELRELLASLWPELRVVGMAASGAEALAVVEEHEPDIAFLDIRMPGLSGVEVARQLLSSGASTRIVFVTAYDAHAIEAFEARAVDYILKPVRPERLAETIERLKTSHRASLNVQSPYTDSHADPSLLATLQQLSADVVRKPLRWINCGQGQDIDVVSVSEVLLFQSKDKYTSVLTAERERYIRIPIKDLIDQLDPEEFWQVHRSSIVRAAAVERVSR
jgi:DNA-binding LytR/AlgR family response regulator